MALSKNRRNALNLTLALTITFFLFLLNILVLYTRDIHVFFDGIGRFRITGIVINSVFFLIAVVLFLAFQQWRRVEKWRRQLEKILSSISPDALVVVDPDRNILTCNASVRRIFGHSQGELIGRKTDMLYLDRRASKETPREIYNALEQRGFHIGFATGRRKDGGAIPLEIVSAELSHGRGAVLLLRDITERIRAQEERGRIEEVIRQRQKLESLGLLAGGIAHDFNNLLAGILGNAELACEAPDKDPQRQKSLQEIIKATQQAAGLCKEMLACAGKGKWHVEPVDLSSVVQTAAHVLQVAVAQRHSLEFALAETLPAVEGDRTQLAQMIHNLVRNSAEAIGDNEGRIVVSTGVLHCDAAYMATTAFEDKPGAGSYVFVRVSDTGCGMEKQTLVRIFEPFFTTKYRQRGLGLAAVRGIAQSHQGAIHVETQPGQGATFTALFRPSVRLPPSEQSLSPAREQPKVGWTGHGTVLVVEDEEAIRRFVESALRNAGLTVLSAANGEEGLALFKVHADRIDVALLDLNMPRLDGGALWSVIKSVRPNLKVIVTSGNRPDNAPWLSEVSGFLQKPFSTAAILDAMRTALEG